MILGMCIRSHAQISCIEDRFRDYGFPEYRCDRLDFYTNGQAKFDALIKDISRARDYIHIEYYKLWNDSTGRMVLDALAEKAKAGVEVKVLYDWYGNSAKKANSTTDFVRHYQSLGVDIRPFDPMKFPYLNHIWPRLHRKMVVIDGRVLYTGGMNIADYYIKGRPEIGAWCDVHARVTGTIVAGYDSLFVSLWYRKYPRDPAQRSILYNWQQHQSDSELDNTGTPTPCRAYIVDRRPGRASANIRKSYIACLDRARHSIRIINPYIMPVKGVRSALVRALRRGVDIQIVLSLKGDGKMSEASTSREVHYLVQRGAKVWLYKPGFHHDKIMVVDDTLCTIGTANLDARSLAFDYEVNGYYVSPEISARLVRYFDSQKQHSEQLTTDNYTQLYSRKVRRRGFYLKAIKGIL